MKPIPSTSAPLLRASDPPARRAAARVALLTFLVLAGLALTWFHPGLPAEYEMDVVFPASPANASEPLAVAGAPLAADFLFVRYLEDGHAVIGHERWSHAAVLSRPFAVRPGERHRLRLTVPAFSHVRGGSMHVGDTLRVALDGSEVLSTPVRFHLRKASRLFFGENPLGGTSCAATFSGELYHSDGRSLRGNARRIFSWPERFRGWLTDGKWQVLALALVSLGAGFAWQRWPLLNRAGWTTHLRALRPILRTHRAMLLTTIGCAGVFTIVVTGGTGRLWYSESFGDFYDYQASAWLHGRFDVPEGALSGEAFIFEGKYFGYFGPTSALLRLPFAIFDLGTGMLSRSFLLAFFVGALLAAHALLREGWRLGGGAEKEPPSWMVVVFLVNAGLGSTLFYLASRAYIYHEAAMAGAAFALVTSACALRYLAAPSKRLWLFAFGSALLALHARPPAGLYALTLLGVVSAGVVALAWYRDRRAPRAAWPQALGLPLLCIAGVFSFNALSYVKFRSFEGAPLRYHVQYDAGRLARIEGRNFHLGNVAYNAGAYLGRTDFTVRPFFPWFHITGTNPARFPRARIDLAEPTLALPYAMPALTVLATLGLAVAFWRRPALRVPSLLTLAAVIPMGGALLAAVAISHRYTTDFLPCLLTLATFALAGLPQSLRKPTLILLLPLTLLSCSITFAITLHYQGALVWGVPEDVTERYRALRIAVDSVFGVRNPELFP